MNEDQFVRGYRPVPGSQPYSQKSDSEKTCPRTPSILDGSEDGLEARADMAWS
jgi:hypothetical protein